METLLDALFLFDSVLMDLYPACAEEMYFDQCNKINVVLYLLLTPKFGTGESLVCGPNLVKSRLVKEDFFKRFGKGLYALILRDCVVTWPERKG
jgi:hypothetical protein